MPSWLRKLLADLGETFMWIFVSRVCKAGLQWWLKLESKGVVAAAQRSKVPTEPVNPEMEREGHQY